MRLLNCDENSDFDFLSNILAEEVAVGLHPGVVEMDADAKVYAAISCEIDVDEGHGSGKSP